MKDTSSRPRRRASHDLRLLLDDDAEVSPGRALLGIRERIERKDGRQVCRVTIYLPPETAEWLRTFCRARELQLSDVVTHAILRLRRTLESNDTAEKR